MLLCFLLLLTDTFDHSLGPTHAILCEGYFAAVFHTRVSLYFE